MSDRIFFTFVTPDRIFFYALDVRSYFFYARDSRDSRAVFFYDGCFLSLSVVFSFVFQYNNRIFFTKGMPNRKKKYDLEISTYAIVFFLHFLFSGPSQTDLL